MVEGDPRWDIDRIPTSTERTAGIALSTILFLLIGTLLIYVIYRMFFAGTPIGQSEIGFALTILALFLVVSALLWRIAFTKAAKPSNIGLAATGYLLVGIGILGLALTAVFGANGRQVSAAVAMLCGGGALVIRSRRRIRS
jgi:hypothetical protein